MTPDSVTIQPAQTTEQLQIISDLAHDIWREYYPALIGSEQVEYMLAQSATLTALQQARANGTRFVLARQDDQPIGYAAVYTDPRAASLAWLDKLYVKQSARGQGIARQMVRWIADQGHLLQATSLCLRVNRHNIGAIRAYQHLGFNAVSQDVKDIGDGYVMDDYIMQASIQRLRLATG